MSAQLKSLLAKPLIWWRHGSLKPGSVALPDSGRRVFINPRDRRAYKKLVVDTARRRVSTPMLFWRDHTRCHASALFLDIGANYGECFASGDYNRSSRCIVVEANRALLPYLERTRDAHPNGSLINIENVLVDSSCRAEASLFYDPEWSGGGCGISVGSGLQEVVVPATTLDRLVSESGVPEGLPIVFKMDIEGFEARAMEGFSAFFSGRPVVGILEFDASFLRRAGSDPKGFFETLAGAMHVYRTFPRSRRLARIRDWASLVADSGGRNNLHCDLVVATSLEMLAPLWAQNAL